MIVGESQTMKDADASDRGGLAQPLLAVRGLKKYFPVRGGLFSRPVANIQAVDGIDCIVHQGETLGIVGESGCGKSTTARLLMHLHRPDAGTIILDGETIESANPASVRKLRQNMQMIFQDSYSSLNPRMTIEETVTFGLKDRGMTSRQRHAQVARVLEAVGLAASSFGQRYPHELSGGQRQRVNIARALAMEPRLVILDEAVSALDKSVEAQVLNLLQDLKQSLRLTYIFISHDLNVVRYISDRVLVMYLGKIVEVGPVEDVYRNPQHPYTAALLSSRPSLDPRRRVQRPPLDGDPPNPVNPPSGCRFRTRCPLAEGVCAGKAPPLVVSAGKGHLSACHARQPGSGHSAAPRDAGGGV